MDSSNSLTPTSCDILSPKPANIPNNLVKLPYNDLDHYADVQYQLLWEDFVYSLREGFKLLKRHLQTGDKKSKNEAEKLIGHYRDVRLEKPYGATLRMVFQKDNRITGKDKVLTSGSLLYFSNDKFKSISTGSIEEVTKDGVVIVRLWDIQNIILHPAAKFDVVENKAYFMAYKPYLNCLKLMTHWHSSSLVDYILGRSCRVKPPKYIRRDTVFEFSANKSKNLSVSIAGLNINKWLPAKDLGLNDGQRKALHLALTNDIAIIQGPPGTGKTYLGVKIVQTLIQNRGLWEDLGPILLVCFTNHGLDQFLEKVVDVIGLKPSQLVRFGSRSESEKLEPYNISRLRKLRRIDSDLHKFYQKRNHIEKMQTEAINKFVLMQAEADRKIIDEVSLRGFMNHIHYQSLIQRANGSGQAMVLWLGEALLNMNNATPKKKPNAANFQKKSIKSDNIIGQMEAVGWKMDAIQSQIKSVFNDALQMNVKAAVRDIHSVKNVWALNDVDRWRMYLFWLNQLRQKFAENVQHLNKAYECNEKMIAIKQGHRDDQLLTNETLIIGMTTTGAALNRELLNVVRPGIVIVEEAAEVTESHVVTALTENCMHLIMIGDHKQLKPHTNCRDLAVKNGTEISFFERMIENGLPYVTLTTQHRMRPKIAELLVPNIYEKLDCHPSVHQYEKIRGMESSVFFLDHKFDFKDKQAANSTSFVNVQEAKFAIALGQYLLQQNYRPSQISILTAYKGQVQLMKDTVKNNVIFNEVRITSIDDYQGEENDIIILSLVRSNFNSKAGFLTIENRVCVALSRARMGLYAIGNFKMLNKIDVWKPIISSMQRDNLMGPMLRIFCQNHPIKKFNMRVAKDFTQMLKGGCGLPCEYIYTECGHRCQLLCHHVDMEHVRACKLRCGRKCPNGHPCQKLCNKPCGPCIVSVTKIHPKCSHPVTVQCQYGDDLLNVKCNSMILMKADCGHMNSIPCYKSKDELKCTKQCSAILPCRHNCHGKCQDCSPHDGIQMHELCKEICSKPLLCGHLCGLTCSEDCLRCNRTCGLSCPHRVCVLPCGINCAPCTKPCNWICPHLKCTKLCHEPCNRPKCNKKCNKMLPCSHRCMGLCGEQCPKACRECSPQDFAKYPLETCFVQLTDCDHIIPVHELDVLMNISASAVTQKSVGFKSCPQCKVCIRSNSRYGNELKVTRMVVAKIREQLRDSQMKHKVYDKLTSIPERVGLMFEMKITVAYIDNFSKSDSDLITLGKITNMVKPLCSTIKHIQVSNALEALSDWVRVWRIEMQRSGFKRKKLEELYLRINRVKLMKQLLIMCEIKSCREDALRAYGNLEQKLFDKTTMKLVELEVRQLASRGKLVKKDRENFEEPSVLFTWNSFGWKTCGDGHFYQLRDDAESLACPQCFAKRSRTKKCVIQ